MFIKCLNACNSFKDRLPERHSCLNCYPSVIKVPSITQSLSSPFLSIIFAKRNEHVAVHEWTELGLGEGLGKQRGVRWTVTPFITVLLCTMNATLIKDVTDERPPWWNITPMQDHPDEMQHPDEYHRDERPPWWNATPWWISPWWIWPWWIWPCRKTTLIECNTLMNITLTKDHPDRM